MSSGFSPDPGCRGEWSSAQSESAPGHDVISQSFQFAGALLLLSAFFLSQRGILSRLSIAYLAANLGGGFLLAIDAWVERQWGFVLLEAAWALVAAASLASALRTPPLGRPR